MTTTVKILIEGNKKCEVVVKDGLSRIVVMPGTFATVCIHGDQAIVVKEVGEFL